MKCLQFGNWCAALILGLSGMREQKVLNLTVLLQVINSHLEFKASGQEISAYSDLRQNEASKLKPFANNGRQK